MLDSDQTALSSVSKTRDSRTDTSYQVMLSLGLRLGLVWLRQAWLGLNGCRGVTYCPRVQQRADWACCYGCTLEIRVQQGRCTISNMAWLGRFGPGWLGLAETVLAWTGFSKRG